jgi:hypothetical protein
MSHVYRAIRNNVHALLPLTGHCQLLGMGAAPSSYRIYFEMHEINISMGQRPSREADSSSAIQEIPRNLWNPKLHYLAHKNPLRHLATS